MMSINDVRNRLRLAVKDRGLTRWCEDNGLRPPYVCNVLAGRRNPGEKLLDVLGLEYVSGYRRKP